MRKIRPKAWLFWYLKDDVLFDLDIPWMRESYVKQILSKGKDEDIKELFSLLSEKEFKEVFNNVKRFLPQKIKSLWEGYFERTLGT